MILLAFFRMILLALFGTMPRLVQASPSPPLPHDPTRPAPHRPQAKVFGVTTTIFEPTRACRIFESTSIADAPTKLIVVGDKQTPPAAWKHYARLSRRVVYLSPSDQLELPFRCVKLMAWKHYGRKSLGFLFAMSKGAEWIFDFDDDAELNAGASAFISSIIMGRARSVPVVETSHHLYNPYPDFQPHLSGQPTTVEQFLWPLGFPLASVRDKRTHHRPANATIDEKRVQVFQALADNNPDVDAVYRMTQELPVDFHLTGAVRALPTGTFAPLRSQATLFRHSAFWGMLLPMSVSSRVSAVWRSYVLERLLWESNSSTVAFASSWVSHHRNPHSYLADHDQEADLRTKTHVLLSLLAGWTSASQSSLPEAYRSLWSTLAVEGLVNHDEIDLVKAWVHDLASIGYNWPVLSTRQVSRTLGEAALVDGRRVHPLPPPPPPPRPPPRTLRELFLDPNQTIPGIDVVFSIRSLGPTGPLHNRDFYNGFFSFWPAGLGSLIHYAEELPVYDKMTQCLNEVRCDAMPFVSRSFDYYKYMHRNQSFRFNSGNLADNLWFAAQMK